MISLVYAILFGLTIASALAVVFSRNAVHGALSLVITMVAIAGIFVLINAQLAAVLQILVYAGAIMVLFLFVIMLLNLRASPPPPRETAFARRAGLALLAVLMLQLVALGAKFAGEMRVTSGGGSSASIADVALHLLTRYLYAFEMTSVLILVAVIGAMVLARKSVMTRGGAESRWGKG